MKLIMTYEGGLRPKTSGKKILRHKHEIRRTFHKQLKRFWEIHPSMANYIVLSPFSFNEMAREFHKGKCKPPAWPKPENEEVHLIDILAHQHNFGNYKFVPLVIDYLYLRCSLHILILRHDAPGSVVHTGDMDNRIKTLIDALRIPNTKQELDSNDEIPKDGENPFFCLLQDDDQIDSFSVDTERLLDPIESQGDENKVRAVITVKIHPYKMIYKNVDFM